MQIATRGFKCTHAQREPGGGKKKSIQIKTGIAGATLNYRQENIILKKK